MTGLVVAAIAALVVADVFLLWWATRTGSSTEIGMRRHVTSLTVAWLAIALNGLHNFQHRSTAEVVSAVTPQTAIEIGLLGLIGVYAFALLRAGLPWPPLRISLGLLPVWVVASTVWADAPLYAAARGVELGAMALLCAATAGFCVTSLHAAETLLRSLARAFIFTTTILIALGAALGPLFVKASEANADRFTWLGAHPVNAGYLLGFCAVLLLTTPTAVLGVQRRTHLLLGVVFAGAIYVNQTRTVVIAVALCAVIMIVRGFRRRPDLATLGTLGLTIGGIAGASAIGAFVLRGGDTEELWTMNGRTDLWSVGFENLTSLGEWTLGLGYGASRVVFVDEFSFATSAHNSLLSALVDIGLIGAGLLLVVVIGTVIDAARAVKVSPVGTSLGGIIGYMIVVGATSDLLLTPGLGTVGVYFVAALSAALLAPPIARPQEPTTHPTDRPRPTAAASPKISERTSPVAITFGRVDGRR